MKFTYSKYSLKLLIIVMMQLDERLILIALDNKIQSFQGNSSLPIPFISLDTQYY